MTAPCELDPAILGLELDQAWEAYETARQALEKTRNLESALRLREVRNHPIMAAFDHISSLVYAWGEHAPDDAANVLVKIEEAIKAARRERQNIAARQKERHG